MASISPELVQVDSAAMVQMLQEFEDLGIPMKFSLLQNTSSAANFQVLLNDSYHVADQNGQPFPNCPSIPAGPEAAGKIYQVLEKLARYQRVKSLHPKSGMNNDFEVRIIREGLGQQPEQTGQTGQQERALEVGHDDIVAIDIENRSNRVLYFAVLGLTPGWAVTQIFPRKPEGTTPLEPGKFSERIRFRSFIPDALRRRNIVEIEDRLKVLVTTEPTQYDMLLSEAISTGDEEPTTPAAGKGLRDSLELSKTPSRDVELLRGLSQDWQTKEVVIKTRFRDGTPS
jgi:hypothetical protein